MRQKLVPMQALRPGKSETLLWREWLSGVVALGSSVGLNRCRGLFTVTVVRGSSGFSTSTRDGSARREVFLREFLEGNSYQKGDTRSNILTTSQPETCWSADIPLQLLIFFYFMVCEEPSLLQTFQSKWFHSEWSRLKKMRSTCLAWPLEIV